MPLPYKVVATDLDGTLLNPDHRVSSYTVRVLDSIAAKGVSVIMATGRHHCDVMATRRKLGLKGYLITSNGACVHDPEDCLIIQKDIDPAVVKELVFMGANNPNVVTSIYRGDSWLMNKEAKDLTEYYQENKDVFFYQLFDPTNQAYDNVYKVYYTSDNRECLDVLLGKVKAAYGDKVDVTLSLPNCMEVMRKGVNKGVALRDIVNMILGNTQENPDGEASSSIKHCIAFGDGLNDLEMLTMAEKGCLMGNAQKDLLKVAPPHLEKIGTNSEDAVAKYLVGLFGVGEEDGVAAKKGL